MKSYEFVKRQRLSLCLVNIVAWLLFGKDVTAFSFLWSSRYLLSGGPCCDRAVNTLAIQHLALHQPCDKKCQPQWRPNYLRSYDLSSSRILASNNFLMAPNDTTTDVRDQNLADRYKSSPIDTTNRKTGCIVELIEPETNCTVRIIGVFHGSHSSAKDVMECITSSTDVVVLELCSDRYRDLIVKKSFEALPMKRPSERGSIESDCDDEESGVRDTDTEFKQSEIASNPRAMSWFEQYIRVVGDAIDRQGWRTGMVVAIFGLVNGFQEQILQLQPGLEFITASEIASNFSIPIVLADQDVTVTLQRIGQLSHTTYDLWYDFLQKRSWGTTFGPLAYALSVAIFGGWMHVDDTPAPTLLTLPQFLTRNIDAIQDLLRFVGLPLFIIELPNLILSLHDSQSVFNYAVGNVDMQQDDPLITTVLNFIVIAIFYLCVALPATQVILMERDDVLTTGIRAACRLAKEKRKAEKRTPRKIANSLLQRISGETGDADQEVEVVVVLGLLHVNGVALRLSQNSKQNLV